MSPRAKIKVNTMAGMALTTTEIRMVGMGGSFCMLTRAKIAEPPNPAPANRAREMASTDYLLTPQLSIID